ncbi:hypothetical protein A3G98_01315 [Candidatus Nomurabacteria bacterium RIFCSPLOWO2_12_FULL_37_8]|uniref:Uncharacterized protein n=1 Tax=Candidatus Nomurabacteria bacterium RIFCSPLOWO2_12_FULL_37_8 TaxID=1801793 RepID=A0A1F6Y4U5_9BACT|nr:MAG: hypothetical protein A3G98_01315 [Candidatus Nomurabacteria bacterium RIFCSPLOWO2_12_FULL_37_8]
MIKFFLQLIVFVGIGLLMTAVPEWQNNVLMNAEVSGWVGYFSTLRLNAVLLLFAYLSFRYLNKKYSPTKTLIFQFTTWGVIGLLFEWILINHPPWSSAIQYGMFVYWAVVFGAPALFILEQAKPIRMKLLGFVVGTAILMIIGSVILLNIDPTKGLLLVFTIASWVLVYSVIISFFFRAMGYPPKMKLLLSAAILVPIAEIILPFPLDFFIFLATIFCSYWYVIKDLPLENLPPKT